MADLELTKHHGLGNDFWSPSIRTSTICRRLAGDCVIDGGGSVPTAC
jgi:hypothetical protein